MKRSENPHQVSIIIPAFNEEKHLQKCLAAINEMNFSRELLEIILVDNGSCDATVQIAKEFGIRVLSKTNGTIASVRNYGTKHANGDIFGFIDADCQVHRDWLRNAIHHFDYPEVAAVGSRLIHAGSTWVAKCWSIIHSKKMETGETEWLPSGNMLVSRRCFNEVNGFDEELITSEDYNLCLKLRSRGYKIISDPKVSSIHLNPPKTLLEFYKKEKWHGQEMLKIFLKGNQGISRAFIYAIFYFVCMIGIFSGVAISLIFGDHSVLIFSISSFVFAPFILAIETAHQSRNHRYVLHLGLMYMVYGVARAISLIGKIV